MKKYLSSSKQGAPDVNSYVYNALADVAMELTQAGYDFTEDEFRSAVDNFINKFFKYE